MNNPQIQDRLPPNWPVTFEMDVNNVWDSFFLNALLLDHEEREEHLVLPHDAPSQVERLAPALRQRNKRMEGPGQEA